MMHHWRNDFAAIGAIDALGGLLFDARAAVVFSRAGDRLLWANRAGGRLFGAGRFSELVRLRFAADNRLRRALRLAQQGLDTNPRLMRLGLPGGGPAAGLRLCRCARVGPPRAEGGILVVDEAAAGPPPAPHAVAAFLAADDTVAVVYDAAGDAVAAEGPGAATPDVAGLRPLADLPAAAKGIARVAVTPDGKSLSVILAAPSAPLFRQPESIPVEGKPNGTTPPPEPPTVEIDPRLDAGLAVGTAVGTTGSEAGMLRRALVEGAEPAPARASETAPAETGTHEQPAPPEPASDLQPRAVRFLWQTDAEHRILFVSPGLRQTVGRTAEVVGEVWVDAAHRLRLDPNGRIWHALKQRDTWSGLTAWWPVDDTMVRIPVELTALPVFGLDQSFQGFRGFGVLKAAEAIKPEEFDRRYGSAEGQGPGVPPADLYEEGMPSVPANVVPLHGDSERAAGLARLSSQERQAFDEIASRLGERVEDGEFSGVRGPRALPEPRQNAGPAPAPSPRAKAATDTRLRGGPVGTDRGEPAAPPHADAGSTGQRRGKPAHPSVEELLAILNTATDGVLIVDGTGTVEDLNGSAEALFAVESAALIGRPFTELLSEDSRQAAYDYLAGLRESGVASVLNEGREVGGLSGTGTIPLFMTMGRLGDGDAERFCAVLRDITAWKRAEAELVAARRKAEQASSHKSDFLARVSHEIRTPLNAIIGFAEVMIEERFGPVDNDRYREYLRDIRTSGEHVVSLVNDLLDISKIESGRLELNFTAVPLNDLVRECMTLMQPQASRAHVVLRASLSPDVPAIVADQRTLRQIVLNLLSNSIKFTGPGGQVITSTSLSADGEAVMRVRDTGRGMSAEDLERALEPFRQISTAALGDRGTGLGLPLTKALVEANRAVFSIESTKGEGTIVRISFPPTRVLSE